LPTVIGIQRSWLGTGPTAPVFKPVKSETRPVNFKSVSMRRLEIEAAASTANCPKRLNSCSLTDALSRTRQIVALELNITI
jgi:hypothetical protein